MTVRNENQETMHFPNQKTKPKASTSCKKLKLQINHQLEQILNFKNIA